MAYHNYAYFMLKAVRYSVMFLQDGYSVMFLQDGYSVMFLQDEHWTVNKLLLNKGIFSWPIGFRLEHYTALLVGITK